MMDATSLLAFDDKARTALAIAKAAPPTEGRLSQLFNAFVHNSLAGFDHKALELSGYWRYRKGYVGDDKRLNVENAVPPDNGKALA
jgi:hypothetical protein